MKIAVTVTGPDGEELASTIEERDAEPRTVAEVIVVLLHAAETHVEAARAREILQRSRLSGSNGGSAV